MQEGRIYVYLFVRSWSGSDPALRCSALGRWSGWQGYRSTCGVSAGFSGRSALDEPYRGPSRAGKAGGNPEGSEGSPLVDCRKASRGYSLFLKATRIFEGTSSFLAMRAPLVAI